MSVLPVGFGGGSAAGYEIEKSVRFRAIASPRASRTPSVAGNRRTWTWSWWVKRGTLGTTQVLLQAGSAAQPYTLLLFTGSNQLQWDEVVPTNTVVANKITTAVYRDPSAWYHIVMSWDSTQATATNRQRLYVNGPQVLAFSASTDPAINTDSQLNLNALTYFGAALDNTVPFDGYLSEINFIDGQALTPSSFGEVDPVTGVWVPKAYAGTYGTNGFYLPFDNGTSLSTLTEDRSGNGNNWTATNISLTSGATYDWMDDTPTNNFAVLNPLDRTQTDNTFSNGNLRVTTGTTGVGFVKSSIELPQTGKWYAEFVLEAAAVEAQTGLVSTDGGNDYVYRSIGSIFNGGTSLQTGLATYTVNDVISVAYNADAGQLQFYKNNVAVGTAVTIPAGRWVFVVKDASAVGSVIWIANFGQRPFAYTPPTGFVTLSTPNLPAPAIANPSEHFDAVTYVGTGATRDITGLEFSPDFVWMKSRGRGVDHALYDIVRGAQAQLESNQTGVETTEATGLTSFNSDGWTMGALDQINGTATPNSFVAWAWNANGAGVANTDGTISSTVSANTTAGFSIVTYTGTGANATVGHGLGVTPALVIVKRRNSASAWPARHKDLAAANTLFLNTNAVSTAAATTWNSTAPTSSVFSIGTATDTNANTGTYVAYCFAEVEGFSKIGSYTGNGNADGPFIYCGFSPAFVLIKRITTATESWIITDYKRDVANLTGRTLSSDLAGLEVPSSVSDYVANGFKLRTALPASNTSGASYIFAAFAESPFNYARAR